MSTTLEQARKRWAEREERGDPEDIFAAGVAPETPADDGLTVPKAKSPARSVVRARKQAPGTSGDAPPAVDLSRVREVTKSLGLRRTLARWIALDDDLADGELTFGKHRGTRLSALCADRDGRSWVQWVLREGSFPAPLTEIFARALERGA